MSTYLTRSQLDSAVRMCREEGSPRLVLLVAGDHLVATPVKSVQEENTLLSNPAYQFQASFNLELPMEDQIRRYEEMSLQDLMHEERILTEEGVAKIRAIYYGQEH